LRVFHPTSKTRLNHQLNFLLATPGRALYFVLLLLFIVHPGLSAYRAATCSLNGMVATPHPDATEAAVEILKAGGNAVDAAVAAAFVLSVVAPYHSGIGGGEFTLVRMVKDSLVITLDARECAPRMATVGLFLDPKTGQPIPAKSANGGLSVGVPGSVAGRVELVKKYGKLSLAQDLAPAIRLAKDGMIVDYYLEGAIKGNLELMAHSEAAGVFLNKGKSWERGDRLIQSALAGTLEQIAKDGGNSFYSGDEAAQIAKTDQAAGGVLAVDDLRNYKVIPREPIKFDYRGLEIYSMPPPSSAGLCLAEILHILEAYPLSTLGFGSGDALHLEASAFERTFADRQKLLGDPAFKKQPMGMSTREYADKRREDINPLHRVPVSGSGDPWPYESSNTSHLSVIDREGNMCSLTTSVNTSFGSFVYVPELGFFLNNTMDDFTIEAKNPNTKTEVVANEVAPDKRPLSSMSPTLILRRGRPWMALGSVGGMRIITSVAQLIVNVVDFGMDLQAAIDSPHIHMQWKPDILYVEDEFAPETIRDLTSRGWKVVKEGHWSLSQAVSIEWNDRYYGGADSRGIGTATGPSPLP
jgi:gamma-glutamyltranspeptidase / glutathione hydrolase